MTDNDMRFLALQRSIDELYDNQVRQRRMLADLLYNLDEENMPAVKALIERYKTEDGEAIAALTLKADKNHAAIESIAAVQTEHGDCIASIEQTASDNTASIESLASVQTKQGESIAGIKQRAEENSASIESLASVQTKQGESIASVEQTANSLSAEVIIAVERANAAKNAASAAESVANTAADTASAAESTANTAANTASAAESAASAAETAAGEANANVSNGAYIIARINEDGSIVKIKADKLELSGYATFNSLKTAGATEIDGANLKTGTVVADSIALNANGQIVLEKLGTLSFYDPSGATGEMRMSENEYGRGEIAVSADGTVSLGAGGASLMLLDIGSGNTEASVYADILRINGDVGISGTYSLGGGSITVVNGIVVGVTEGNGSGGDNSGGEGEEGGGGADTPITLYAPGISLNEAGGFLISNPNGVGTIAYYTYWYDESGNSGDSVTDYDDSSSVSGYVFDYPPGGGYIGVSAWIEYEGRTSPGASEEVWYA